jgi:hypothetical protein
MSHRLCGPPGPVLPSVSGKNTRSTHSCRVGNIISSMYFMYLKPLSLFPVWQRPSMFYFGTLQFGELCRSCARHHSSFSRRICVRDLFHSPRKKAEGAERRKARTVATALARRGAHLAIGAQRLPALHCGIRQGSYPSAQPRAAFPGTAGCKREDPPRRQCSELLADRS